MGKKWRPLWRRKKKSQKEAQAQKAAPENESKTHKTGGERPSRVEDGSSTITCGCISRVRSRFGCGTAPASPCKDADSPVWHVVRLSGPQALGDGPRRPCKDVMSPLPRGPDVDSAAAAPAHSPPSMPPSVLDAELASGRTSAGELRPRNLDLQLVASGNDSSDPSQAASLSVTTTSSMIYDGHCPPRGSPPLLPLGDPPAPDADVDTAPATTPVPVPDDRAAIAGWLLGRLSPIPESEDSDVNHTPATSNVGADIKLLISPSGFLRLNDAVNTPSRSVPNKSAELPRRLILDDDAPYTELVSPRNTTPTTGTSVSLANWLAASNSDCDSTAQPASPGSALALPPVPSTPPTVANTELIAPDSAFAWSLPLPSSAASLACSNPSASPLPSRRRRAAGTSPLSSVGDNFPALEDSRDAVAALLMMGQDEAQPNCSARLTWHSNDLAVCDPKDSGNAAATQLMLGSNAQPNRDAMLTWRTNELAVGAPDSGDSGDVAAALLMLGGDAQPDSGALLTWRTHELAVPDSEDSDDAAAALLMLGADAQPDHGPLLMGRTNKLAVCAPAAAGNGDNGHSAGHSAGQVQALLQGSNEAPAVEGNRTLVLYDGVSTDATTMAVSNQLLGQLDISIAEAQMARQELAIAKADVHALEEHVQELQEEVHNERETSAAARQRANVIERQMADHEREVRTLEDCLEQARMDLVAVELDAERTAGQVTVLETEMATSKAAAQAAAEAAAHDIACLSTALMRTEARCNELQTAHGEEMAVVTSELRRARDESHTLADDIIAMAEKSTRDEEHIAMLQAALRESQASQRNAAALVAACTQQMAALLNPPEPADTLACEGGAADIVSNNADRDDGADDALDAAERGCARTALAPLADHQTRERETAAKPAACRTPIAASPISSSGSPAHESDAAPHSLEEASPQRQPLQELPLPARGTGNILRRTVSGGAAAAAATASLLRSTSAKWKRKLGRLR